MYFRYHKIACANVGSSYKKLVEWHSRMASQVKSILKRDGMDYEGKIETTCTSCVKGKQHKLSLTLSDEHAKKQETRTDIASGLLLSNRMLVIGWS